MGSKHKLYMPHTPTDMSKWWTGSSCKLCQKLVISPFQSEISDVPVGCISSPYYKPSGIFKCGRRYNKLTLMSQQIYCPFLSIWYIFAKIVTHALLLTLQAISFTYIPSGTCNKYSIELFPNIDFRFDVVF